MFQLKGYFKKKSEMIMKERKEEPKGDEYIVGPYLRQMVENI